MPKITPKYCRPEAFSLLAAQMDEVETLSGLINGAVAISMHEMPHAQPLEAHAQLDRLAESLRSRVRSNKVGAVLAHAHQMLFEEEGFAGSTQDYYNPRNSYLPAVLEGKRGLPILLVLIYKAVLERVGVHVWGINAPAHFLAGVEADAGQAPMLIDPFFGGRLLSLSEALEQIQSMTGAVEPQEVLAVSTHRQWLARMTRNLEAVFARADRYADVSAMIEMRLLLGEDA